MNTSRTLQFCTIAALATTSVLSGFSPDRLVGQLTSQLTNQPSQSQAAYAEESSFTRYVRAVFEIEQERRSLISQIKSMTGGDLPDKVCTTGFSKLQEQFQGPVSETCNRFNKTAAQIVSKYNLGGEFTSFRKQALSSDRNVKREMQKRVSDEMRRLQLI